MEVKITGIFLESNFLATAHFAADKGSEALLNDLASSVSQVLIHPPRQNPVIYEIVCCFSKFKHHLK